MAKATSIRVGIGGWTYEPWRDNFYPKGLAQARELGYASRQLTAIEVNGTYYSTMKPVSFRKWHDDTPEDFVFSLKASRFATNRRVLADAGESIARFVGSGISELGDKLGPIVWQFMPTKQFEAGDFEAFLALLPSDVDGRKLRHVLDVRHPSFIVPEYLKLARQYQCASVFTDSDKFPSFSDVTGDFVYARLMKSEAKLKTGYPAKALDGWMQAAQSWAAGSEPGTLPRVEAQVEAQLGKKTNAKANAKRKPPAARDVFIFFINGAKERAPAAAQALIARLAKPVKSGLSPGS